jgi:radical SAM protein with 4Fe4S-binding SPASM domain
MSYFLDKPEVVKVSLTNICNYRCVMCFNPSLRQARGRMEGDLLRRVVDMTVEAGVGKISLGASGEPLLHPEFLSFLAYAKSRGLWVSTTTNASRLTPELSAEILGLGINRVNLSIYSTTDREHRDYTGTGLFDQVVANIRAFLQLWKKQGRPCTLNMWFLPIPGVNSLETHLAYWKPLADEVGLEIVNQPMLTWAGVDDSAAWAPPRLAREGDRLALRWQRRRPCPDLRGHLMVLHTGEVLPCCQLPEPDPAGSLVFGRLPENSITEIWSSERYQAFKRAHFRRRIEGYPTCLKCAHSRESRRISVPLW